MNVSKIPVRYSKALLLSAIEQGKLKPVYEDMEQVYRTCREVSEFMEMLRNPIIPPSKKREILQAIFSNRLNGLTLSFLDLLVQNKREIFIPDIARRFLDDYKQHSGITTVALTTVVKVGDETRKRIIHLIKNAMKTEVELIEELNGELIGGFILRIGDKMVDASVARELHNFRRELISTGYQPH